MSVILNPQNHLSAATKFQKFFAVIPKKPSLPFLNEILSHFLKLPYENISKIIKSENYRRIEDKIRLPEEIISAHIENHLGGTCYSLTFFLNTILTANGFECYPITAHMKNRKNVHTALIVLIDKNKFLVDSGYLFNKPIPINRFSNGFQKVAHTNVFSFFQKQDSCYHIYTFNFSGKKWRYCFRDEPLSYHDFFRFWQESFSPKALNGICLNLLQDDKMIYFQNNYLQITSQKEKKKRIINDNYDEIVKNIFGISPEFVEQSGMIISKRTVL